MALTIGQPEILKMDVCFGVKLARRLDERVHKGIIFLASYSLFPETKVKRVV